jgi:hypothetical protein
MPYQATIRVTNDRDERENLQALLVGLDANTASGDAFNRQRVSEPAGLFDSQHEYDTSPLLWDTTLTGSGTATHLPNESSVRLRVDGPSQGVVRQTRAYFRYQPGKSQFVMCTFAFPTLEVGTTRRVGYFDASNGIFLELNANNAFLVLRSSTSGSPVDTKVAQASWNADALNGTGESKIRLDFTRSQIFAIDLEWLGVGRVRAGFVVDGVIRPAHEFLNANVYEKVYMTTANLPVRYELVSDGTSLVTNHDLIQICSTVISEGGAEIERGLPFATSNGVTSIAVTTRRPILSIRPKATFNSIVNRGMILPESVGLYSHDQSAFVEVVVGGALTGASFASVDTASIVERDIGATAVTGGVVIGAFIVPASTLGINKDPGTESRAILSKLPLALDAAGNHPISPLSDVLSLVATSWATSTACSGVINWRELR